jgi:two-component system OmpR family response regulator
MKVLIVEDDREVVGVVQRGLRKAGCDVAVAWDGDEGAALARGQHFDVIVLDWELPGMSGPDVAAALRREGRNTPILMLTGRAATDDVVRGLDAGADDYLTKPFELAELLARVRAMARRAAAPRVDALSYGPIAMERLTHKVTVGGVKLGLTPKEFQLLEHFLLRPEEAISRAELLEQVWDGERDPASNLVDVHVGNLRRKLKQACGAEVVQTVRGKGFRLALFPGELP